MTSLSKVFRSFFSSLGFEPFSKRWEGDGPLCKGAESGIFLESVGGGVSGRSPSTTCLPLNTTYCKAQRFFSSRFSSLVQVLPASEHPNLSLLPTGGPGLFLPSSMVITCRHEEDASTQDDVMSSLVELAGCDAESTHEK